MARYRFRLQTLRRLREIARDELRVRLAEAYQAERILADQQSALEAERGELAELQRRMVAGGTVDVNRLLGAQRYQLLLEAQSRTLAEQAARLAEEVERRREALVAGDREVRVLDKLRERGERQHRRTAERAQAKQLDELASNRWEASRWV
jgi:flagellar export protein FliJ